MPVPPPPEVRPARAGDVPALARAYEWLFAAPGSVPPGWDADVAADRLREVVEGEAGTALVACADTGSIVGFCTVYRDILSVRFGRRAWVEDLAVDRRWRSQGVGKALLDAAKAWARARGCSHLELDSAFARTDAHRFYERERPDSTSVTFGWALR